jgi:hypothetical protein
MSGRRQGGRGGYRQGIAVGRGILQSPLTPNPFPSDTDAAGEFELQIRATTQVTLFPDSRSEFASSIDTGGEGEMSVLRLGVLNFS